MSDEMSADDAERLAGEIVRDVCDLPDRKSHDGQPDAMMVSWQELQTIIIETLRPAFDAREAALRDARAEIEKLRAQLHPSTREHVATLPVLAISPEDLIYRLRQHVRNRGAPHLPNGAWALMLEAADQVERLTQALIDKERETIERCALIADREAKSLKINGPIQASIVARYIAQRVRALAARAPETKP